MTCWWGKLSCVLYRRVDRLKMDEAEKVDLGVTVEVSDGMQINKAKIDDKADDMGAYGEDDIDRGEGDTGMMPKFPEIDIEPVNSVEDSEKATGECDSDINIAPVECPRDCLVMYGLKPHKYVLRSVNNRSWMLHYMFQERHNLQQNDGNVLEYLPTVLRKMADHHKSTFAGQKVKLCGTIYHCLTRKVFMKKM